jgi:elongation factor P
MAGPTDIRKGKVIDYQGAPHLVLEMQHRTQGRQAGFVQATLRNLRTGSSTVTKFRSTDSVSFLHTETRDLEFSYHDAMGYHFLDPITFEDVPLSDKLVAPSKAYMVPGRVYTILFVDEAPVEVQLPAAVEMRIVEAPEGVRGDSASNVMKPVTTETGLIIQAPLFIQKDEVIRVSTTDNQYLGRA